MDVPILRLESRPQPGASGVALIVTLMMMSVLVMMVVGLAGVMRNEQAAARNLTYQVLAEQLAEIGARQAMAIVKSNSVGINPISLKATGPGWMLCDGQTVPLFVEQPVQGTKNLEEIGTNSLILGLSTNAGGRATRGTIISGWSNLSSGRIEIPFGRYAWWVDDEGGKMNVNYAGPDNGMIFPSCTPFPLVADYAFWDATWGPNNASALRARKLANRSNWIFTSESLKDTNATSMTNANEQIGPTVYRRIKGHVTAWASNVNLNPYSRQRYSLTNLANPLTIANDTNFGALMQATFANPGLTNTNNLIYFRRDFTEKYGNGDRGLGNLVLRQAMANAYEAIRFNPTNMSNAPLQSSNLTTLAGTGITNVPRDWQGLTPASLYLNEICAQAFYFNNPPDRCQFQIWVWAELVNLSSTNTPNSHALILGPGNGAIRVRGSTSAGRFTNTINLVAFSKTNGSASVNLGRISTNVSPYGLFTTRAWFVFAFQLDSRATDLQYRVAQAGSMSEMSIDGFPLANVVLMRRFGTQMVPVDWIQGSLPLINLTATATNSAVPPELGNPSYYGFSATDPLAATLNPALPTGINVQAFSKIDPRFRVFPGWVGAGNLSNFSAWTVRPATYGQGNQGQPTMLPGWSLKADTITGTNVADGNRARLWWPGTNFLYSDTNLPVPGWSFQGTNFPSAAALGFIHTGLPWRTFRLTPRNDDPDPPDWLVLDLFSAGATDSAVPAINLNGLYQALANSNTNASANRMTGVTNRFPAVMSLLASMTNNPGNFNKAGNQPLWSNQWSSATLANALTNLQSTNTNRWILNSWWDTTRRSAASVLTNPAIMVFRGELAEIRGVGDTGTTDEDREAPLMVLGDLVTTRSDTFSVWSAGQGLQVVTNSAGQAVRTNIMAEIRKQTVFQRVPQFGPDNNVTGYKLRVLYTRNHIVE